MIMKTMNGWLGALVLGVTLSTGSIACAQANDNSAQREARAAAWHGDHGGDPAKMAEKRIERMKENLNLTDAQAAQIKNIYAQNQAKLTQDFQNMKAAAKGSDQQKAARLQMKTDMDAIQVQVRGVLTADQQSKWDTFKKEHEKRDGDHENRDARKKSDTK